MGQRFYIKSLFNQYTNLGTKSGHFTWVTSGLWDVSNFERVIKARDPHQTFRSLLVPLYTVSIGRDCARICHYATQLPNSSLEFSMFNVAEMALDVASVDSFLSVFKLLK